MPRPIIFDEPMTSNLRNGLLNNHGLLVEAYHTEVSIFATRKNGEKATGHIGIHPGALPDLIAQLVEIHVTNHPGEAHLIRAMVESAIPPEAELSQGELEAISQPPRP